MISQIDFQNGMAVGLTLGGLTKSGLAYEPLIWTENWARDHFFIDFKRLLKPFSMSQFRSSISVFNDSTGYLFIEDVEHVEGSIYKVTCDMSAVDIKVVVAISDFNFLTFTSGEKVFNFYKSFNIRYIPPSILLFVYDVADNVNLEFNNRFKNIIANETVYPRAFNTVFPTAIDSITGIDEMLKNRFGSITADENISVEVGGNF